MENSQCKKKKTATLAMLAASRPPPLCGASESHILFTVDSGWTHMSLWGYSCICVVLARGPVSKYWRQVAVNQDMFFTSGIRITPSLSRLSSDDPIGHTSRKMSMILSVCSPTRCFRKFTWHFLERRMILFESWKQEERVKPWERGVADITDEEDAVIRL